MNSEFLGPWSLVPHCSAPPVMSSKQSVLQAAGFEFEVWTPWDRATNSWPRTSLASQSLLL